ncbi:MAG: hypothetical protein WB615_03475 [Candidatus Tumulicola sp.]
MTSLIRILIVTVIGVWMLGTGVPDLSRLWHPFPSNGLTTDYDGVVTDVEAGSPAIAASIAPGDRILPPLPRDLFRDPPGTMSFKLLHAGRTRSVSLSPRLRSLKTEEKLRLLALYLSYLIFLIVGSAVLLLRPNAMTWSFYLYCVLRRYGDLGFYWPGSHAFFWFNLIAFAALGGAGCALVVIFALRFPNNRLDRWRRPLNRGALVFAFLLPLAWLYASIQVSFLEWPSQSLVNVLTWLTSAVYLIAAAIFIVTLLQSRGEDRQRMQWILVFPIVLVMRVIAINVPSSLFSDILAALAIGIPLAVAYAVIRRRVFDIEFAISRALVYGTITSLIAGTFLLLDWFMSEQFAETRFTLTAEIIVALAFGSWLNLLHRNVDGFVDKTFFRQRHLSEQRLARAAAAVLRAESHEAVDRFLVHEPVAALELMSAALFRRSETNGRYIREMAIGWNSGDPQELGSDEPLVLHLLAEGAPLRLADVRWSSDESPFRVGNAVLATPVLLREELAAIVLYGPHRSGADIDPDEVRGLLPLAERAGAAYDHIEARTLRARVATLLQERDEKEHEIVELRAAEKATRRPSGA